MLVLNSYPFATQTKIDNLGGLVFNYLLRTKEHKHGKK